MNEILIHLDEAAPISVSGDKIERTGDGYLEVRAAGELVAVMAPGRWGGAVIVAQESISVSGCDVPPFSELVDLMNAHRAVMGADGLSRAQMITDIRSVSSFPVSDLELLSNSLLLRLWKKTAGPRSPKSTPESLGAAATEG